MDARLQDAGDRATRLSSPNAAYGTSGRGIERRREQAAEASRRALPGW